MAFLGPMSSTPSSNNGETVPSTTSIPTSLADHLLQRGSSAAELLSNLDPQLLAQLQQQNSNGFAQLNQTQHQQSDAINSSVQLYQQLLAHHQMQQNSQPPSLPISPPASNVQSQSNISTNDLIQQLASTLLVNPNLASSLQPQLASLAQHQQQVSNASAFSAPNPNLAALSSMINASPSLLPSLLNANGQSTSGANQNVNPLAALTSQLLMGGNATGNAQNNLLPLLNLLQQTNPLLASQLLLQYQQQQQAAQMQVNPNLALIAQLMGSANGANGGNQLADMNQLAALLQQTQVPSQGIPSNGEQTPKTAYDEYLLRQKHQQDPHQALAASIAAASQQLPGRLSTQNSSNSLLSGLTGGGFESPTSTNTMHGHPVTNSMQSEQTMMSAAANSMIQNMNGASQQQSATPSMQSASRQASSDRLLSNAESVQDHISRLISENEAIVEQNPILLKRRPYHRQSTSNSIISQTSEMSGSSQQNSPGIFHQVLTTRSQSMHESQMSQHCGSLTSGQPIVRHPYQQQQSQGSNGQSTQANLTCTFCGVKFPNDAGLQAHQIRCSKKEQLTKHQSQPQFQLNLLNAQQQQQLYMMQQQQKLKQHQSNIAALVGGGAGVAPDPVVLNGSAPTGRSSVPIGSSRAPGVQASPPIPNSLGNAGSPSTSSTGSENRHPLKKRLLESVTKNSSEALHSATSSPTSVTPSASTTNSSSMPNIDLPEAQNSPAKIAKLDRRSLDETRHNTHELLDKPTTSHDSVVEDLKNALQKPESNAHQLLQQLVKQILFAPIVADRCPKRMKDSILYCTSYIEAKISTKMPYVLTLDKKISEHYRKHNKFVTPALLVSRGRARNVTVDLNTTHKIVPNHRQMSQGQSMYSVYGKEQKALVSVEDEMHLLLSLRNSSHPIQFLNYTTPNDTFKNRTTHSEYWTSDAKDRILSVSTAPELTPIELEPIQQTIENKPEPISTIPEISTTQLTPIKQEPDLDVEDEKVESSSDEDDEMDDEDEKESKPDKRLTEAVTKRPKINLNLKHLGKDRPEEVEVYVRGRGRGRYVCEQCGIKCKKPSMLKKHLNVHTNIRLFKCITCNFAFKTKGNLTKHLLGSKTHRIKVASSRSNVETPKMNADGSAAEVITTEAENNAVINLGVREARFVNDEFDSQHYEDDNESDNESNEHHEREEHWRFGQENTLYQRSTHTPPTLWTLCEARNLLLSEDQPPSYWPKPKENRSCNSAPPTFLWSPTPDRHKLARENAQKLASASSSLGFNVVPTVEMSSPMVASDCGEIAGISGNNELLTNYIPMLRPMDPIQSQINPVNTNSTEFDYNSLFGNDSHESQCELCEKKFRKASDLHLHRQTHLIEQQQNSRTRTYQCPECKVVHRSRAHLEKHLLEQHENLALNENSTPTIPLNDLDSLTNSIPSSSSNISSINTTIIDPASLNQRKYACSDCNIGFRTHGVLAKHLRTKNHVKSLSQQGKLPEDAMALIKENSTLLANVDATNCEQARVSLLKILDQLRNNGQSSDSKNGSLECVERLITSPSTNELSIGISQRHANSFQQKPMSIAGQKRKNSERHSEGESLSQRPRSNSCMIGISTAAQRRLVDGANHQMAKSGSSTPGGGLNASNAYRLNSNGRAYGNPPPFSHIVGANVWTPPLVDQLILDDKNHHHHFDGHGAESVASSTREEAMSESTGRSESSTPVQRQNNHNILNTNIASPIPSTTTCILCDLNFETPANLQVHFHAEHISFHDGNDFKCPRRNCDKIFPNRVSLRNHITAHFIGGGATPIPHEDSTLLVSPSELDSNQTNQRKITTTTNGTSQLVPNHSPGAPEATHTVGEDQVNKQAANSKNEEQKQSLLCSMCNNVEFADAKQLQTHWMTEHLPQLNNRNHICKICDAAFTTSDSLRAHSETHK